jgi:hypothetical protein
VAIEISELQLVWPPDLFAQEAEALFAAGRTSRNTLGLLLDEAFYEHRGLKLFDELPGDVIDPWSGPTKTPEVVSVIRHLIVKADELPRYVPRRYYSARRNPPTEPALLTMEETKAEYGREVAQLARSGYFDDAFGPSSSKGGDATEGQHRLSELLATDMPMWPLEHWVEDRGLEPTGVEKNWTDDLFYDVIEALHDLVARPRRRSWDEDYYDDWIYWDFARAPGQTLYRWRVNQLLSRSEVPLRLAESGSDIGRVVTAPGDARDELVQQVLQSPDPKVRDLVDHAVAQFRARGATVLAKREATKVLADVLERRRDLLKRELFSKDESDLFNIANRFEIRHLDQQQKGDYDPVFLDWAFWWFLATIELTDRLLARQNAAVSAATS